jgi:hypothetical protein
MLTQRMTKFNYLLHVYCSTYNHKRELLLRIPVAVDRVTAHLANSLYIALDIYVIAKCKFRYSRQSYCIQIVPVDLLFFSVTYRTICSAMNLL